MKKQGHLSQSCRHALSPPPSSAGVTETAKLHHSVFFHCPARKTELPAEHYGKKHCKNTQNIKPLHSDYKILPKNLESALNYVFLLQLGHRKDADRITRDTRERSSGCPKAHVAGCRKFLAQRLLNRNEGRTFPYVPSAQPVKMY